ncbi:phospholipase A2-like isoform X1 [Neodiprion pinetum]|uniref:phospholipase A2-like isoform X1 n=1 Tax=Neodiprion pinetum TaxID=441929 RepID=UPI001EE15420|nr:uncharacterized protein LOC124217531 isoform X2 [Neodiprion pinetum]
MRAIPANAADACRYIRVDLYVPVNRANSRPPGFGPAGSSKSVSLGYGGDPWGTSSGATHAAKERHAGFSWQTQSAPASRNVLNTTEIEFNPEAENNSSQLGRSKRALWNLYNVLSCGTVCDPFDYVGYGCYCGFSGSGYPVDGIDRCCMYHDWCYEAADYWPSWLMYLVHYKWKCYRGYLPICDYKRGWGQRLCECDRELARCLSSYPCPTTQPECWS